MRTSLFFLLLVMFPVVTFAQVISRVQIEGEVSAPIGDDVEGIVVINQTTKRGTITNKKGRFKITVGLNDRIEIAAMQFQRFTVIVNQGVINNKRLNVFLEESVKILDEVVVSPYELSGNVNVDVARIGVNKNDIPLLKSSKTNEYEYEWRPDTQTVPENDLIYMRGIQNGLNFVNLFRLAFKKVKKSNTKNNVDQGLDQKVRALYNDQFFKDNLAIEIDQINDFIFFAEENGLDSEYFEEGRELDLIQLLVSKSELYKKQK